MKYCRNCGRTVRGNSESVCSVCGAYLEPLQSPARNPGASDGPVKAWYIPTFRHVYYGLIVAGILALSGAALLLLNTAIRDPYGDPPIPAVKTDFTALRLPQPVSRFLDTATDGLQSAMTQVFQNGGQEKVDVPTLVLHGAMQDAVITVDGQPVDFTYEGEDALVPVDKLTAPCAVRIVAPSGDGWQTAAVWYDGSATELTLGAEDGSGAYTACEESGLAAPSVQFLDGLTRAYYLSFLQSINEQDSSLLRYTTDANRQLQEGSIYNASNSKNLYDTQNFTAVSEPSSVMYNDGQVLYNASFVCYPTNRTTGESKTISNHRTIRLVWDGTQWLVDYAAFLSEPDFAAGNYRTG